MIASRSAAVPAEDEEGVEEDLVAAVADHELVRGHAVALRQRLAQLGRPGRVAVQEDLVQLLRREPLSRAVRLGPLVRL